MVHYLPTYQIELPWAFSVSTLNRQDWLQNFRCSVQNENVAPFGQRRALNQRQAGPCVTAWGCMAMKLAPSTLMRTLFVLSSYMLFPHLEHPSTSTQLLPTLSLTLFPLHPCWATSWGLIFRHLSGPSPPEAYSSPNHLHTLILSLIIYFPVLFSMSFIHHLLWVNYLPWPGTLSLPPFLPNCTRYWVY